MDDEIDRRLERLGDRQFAIEPIFQLQPIIDPVGQPFVIDDDQQVEIRLITFGRMRFIDPSAARIAAIENDLLDPALLLPLVRGERQRIFELLEDDLHDALDFASFLCRSEEHTSELQSLMRNSYAVFCLKKKKTKITQLTTH